MSVTLRLAHAPRMFWIVVVPVTWTQAADAGIVIVAALATVVLQLSSIPVLFAMVTILLPAEAESNSAGLSPSLSSFPTMVI